MAERRYAIYGVNRVAKDFLYIFDTLEIVCFFEDVPQKELFLTKSVYTLSDYEKQKNTFDKLIVCGADHSSQSSRLEQLGLFYGRDYCFEENFFEELDPSRVNPEQKQIAIWGTGKRATRFCKECDEVAVSIVLDKNPEITEWRGHKVMRPSEIAGWKSLFVIIAVADDIEIREMLEEAGMKEYKDFISSASFETLPSRMLRKTIFDPHSYDLNCTTMLNHIEVGGIEGYMIGCCSTFNSTVIGRLKDGNMLSAWNGMVHKILCLSNVNRTYSFCDKSMCPLLIGRTQKDNPEITKPYPQMRQYPTTAAVSHDYSCNLKCITCRNGYRHASKEEMEEIEKRSETITAEFLPHTEFLITAGDGEVFLSKAYRSIYTHPNMKFVKWLRFLTNGLLFTPERWKELRAVYTGKVMMTVSIDAATKETYEKIRSGGRFDVLKRNMEYAASLRKTGDLSYLRFNFVVQKENYREMPLFVKWGQDLGVDELFFTKILNWGTYSPEEFSEISMMEPDGITPKPELEEILNLQEMQNRKVDLGTIRSHHERVPEDTIENYYRWELERKVPGLFVAEEN